MYYFYILKSEKNGKLYIGHTNNLRRRLIEHNAGNTESIKPYTPYKLIYYAAFTNEKDAIASEHYFKTSAGWKRIHKMLGNTLASSTK